MATNKTTHISNIVWKHFLLLGSWIVVQEWDNRKTEKYRGRNVLGILINVYLEFNQLPKPFLYFNKINYILLKKLVTCFFFSDSPLTTRNDMSTIIRVLDDC